MFIFLYPLIIIHYINFNAFRIFYLTWIKKNIFYVFKLKKTPFNSVHFIGEILHVFSWPRLLLLGLFSLIFMDSFSG